MVTDYIVICNDLLKFDPATFYSKCLYQGRRLSGHVYVCKGHQFSLCCYGFLITVLMEGYFCFSFYYCTWG